MTQLKIITVLAILVLGAQAQPALQGTCLEPQRISFNPQPPKQGGKVTITFDFDNPAYR